VIGESQLIGYPTQFPSVSMMDWENNKPNARFWALKLLKDSFHPGDEMVETSVGSKDLAAQAYITSTGRKMLIVNKRNRALEISLPDAGKASALTVDPSTGDGPARSITTAGGTIALEPFAVTVVSW
jgi:hypothetical protein